MRELFKKDITLKVGAVLIAILFWLYVYNNANPYTTQTFQNIPIKFENQDFVEDNGYIIKNNYRTSIDITIRGRQEAVNRVKSSDFAATLDFSQIKSLDDKTLTVTDISCRQKDVVIESIQPAAIDVQLSRYKTNSFPIEIVNNITMKPGYKLLDVTPNPENISLVYEESLINSVGSVKATLDIKDLDRNVVRSIDCKVYSKDGKVISELSRNLKVEVSVAVAKEVPVTLVTKGKPAADFVETLRTVTPETVLITGPPELLSKITDLKTEPVDIENITENFTVTPVIKLPEGVKFADPQKDVAASITVEKLAQKELSVPKGGIRIMNPDGSLTYEILTENSLLQLRGRISDLNALNLAGLQPGVDVAGLAEGTHKLPLNIVLPAQVKLMQDVLVEVKVTKVEAPPT